MKQSENINELAEALSAFQGEVNDVFKSSQGYGYNYADLSSVLETARPAMAKHGLAVTQMPGRSEGLVTMSTTLMHKSGQWMRSTMAMEVDQVGKMSPAQCVGSVLTYLRRYSLSAVLGISQTDTDASQAVVAPKKRINREVVQGSMVALLASVEDGDGLGAKQIMNELRDTPEQDATWQLFTTRQKNAIKALVNGVEG